MSIGLYTAGRLGPGCRTRDARSECISGTRPTAALSGCVQVGTPRDNGGSNRGLRRHGLHGRGERATRTRGPVGVDGIAGRTRHKCCRPANHPSRTLPARPQPSRSRANRGRRTALSGRPSAYRLCRRRGLGLPGSSRASGAAGIGAPSGRNHDDG